MLLRNRTTADSHSVSDIITLVLHQHYHMYSAQHQARIRVHVVFARCTSMMHLYRTRATPVQSLLGSTVSPVPSHTISLLSSSHARLAPFLPLIHRHHSYASVKCPTYANFFPNRNWVWLRAFPQSTNSAPCILQSKKSTNAMLNQ